MPLLLVACPSFTDVWKQIESENGPDSPGESRLHYVDAIEFAAHLVGQLRAGNRTEVSAAFVVIERLHLEGDAYVRELATIGYLEGLLDLDDPDRFKEYLGPESQRWWRGLIAFWSGKIPTVQAID